MSIDQLNMVYVPRFGSQVRCSQSDWPQCKEYLIELPSQGREVEKRGKTKKGLSTKKVKLTKFDSPVLLKTPKGDDETLKRSMPQLVVKRKGACVNQGGEDSQSTESSQLTLAGPTVNTVCVKGGNADAFTFSKRDTSEKEKSKLAVLKTISRMLQENRCIRQRIASLSQTICGQTDWTQPR